MVHALFAGHFLRQEQTPFHDCAISRHSTFAAGAASVILLGSCCTVTAFGTARPLRSTPDGCDGHREHPCVHTVVRMDGG